MSSTELEIIFQGEKQVTGKQKGASYFQENEQWTPSDQGRNL